VSSIETTATFEGPAYLRLAHPVDNAVEGEVRVIVFFEESKVSAPRDFRAAIGSYYRDYPDEPVRNSEAWLKELREGEES
jgi:hypothetical protein